MNMVISKDTDRKPLFNIKEPYFLPIKDSNKTFPLGSIYCVGRNYAAHSLEMGEDDRFPPFFFSKPQWTISNTDVKYPLDTVDLQYEVELVLAMGADSVISGFCVGVDLTRRDLQKKAKNEGKPWFRGKSFLGSSVVSKIVLFKEKINFKDIKLKLFVNSQLKQDGLCSDMIWSPNEIMCELSRDKKLDSGDLIFTGTPSGVGKVEKGDEIMISIPGFVEHTFFVI
jgi:fumarylpyruvate hydrolase